MLGARLGSRATRARLLEAACAPPPAVAAVPPRARIIHAARTLLVTALRLALAQDRTLIGREVRSCRHSIAVTGGEQTARNWKACDRQHLFCSPARQMTPKLGSQFRKKRGH
jgi:hypothetical protein